MPFAKSAMPQDHPTVCQGHENGAAPTTEVLLLEGAQQEFVFTEVPERPVPSLLRGFSAPVKLEVCERTPQCGSQYTAWLAARSSSQRPGLLCNILAQAVVLLGCTLQQKMRLIGRKGCMLTEVSAPKGSEQTYRSVC